MIWARLGKVGGWVLVLLESIIGKLLVMFGLSYVTYEGLDLLIDEFRTRFVSGIQHLDSTAFALFSLAGGVQATSIVLGAISTRMLIMGAQSFSRFVSKGSS